MAIFGIMYMFFISPRKRLRNELQEVFASDSVQSCQIQPCWYRVFFEIPQRYQRRCRRANSISSKQHHRRKEWWPSTALQWSFCTHTQGLKSPEYCGWISQSTQKRFWKENWGITMRTAWSRGNCMHYATAPTSGLSNCTLTIYSYF